MNQTLENIFINTDEILEDFNLTELDHLESYVDSLPKGKNIIDMVAWAESKRYLPPEITNRPGMFDWSLCPHLIEPALCLSANNPTQRVILCKGVQVAASTGLIENLIGYTVEHDPCGMMLAREEKEAAETAMELRVEPMLRHSGLIDLIYSKSNITGEKSSDRKLFKRFPNGFLQAIGVRNANKARSLPIKKLLRDEIDAWPQRTVDKESGRPLQLTEKRTATYEHSRKILDVSTPLKMATSEIWKLLLQTDNCHRFVPCPFCGTMQELIWLDKKKDTGFFYKTDKDFNLIPNSTYYKCINPKCKGEIRESHKYKMMNAGEYKASLDEDGNPKKSALYLARGFFVPSWYSLLESWDECSRDWIQSVKDHDFESFYNLRKAKPFEDVETRPRAEMLRGKQRDYNSRTVPNEIAIKDGNGPILILTCAVDVHKKKTAADGRLDVEVLGHCRNGSTYSILWERLQGDTEPYWFREYSAAYQADVEALEKNTWHRLFEEILSKQYIGDDGTPYAIKLTGIDMAYEGYMVQTFCKQFEGGIIPILGQSKEKNFVHYIKEAKSDHGRYYQIMVDKYKDRLADYMALPWVGQTMPQPAGYLNYPSSPDYNKEYFNMYGGEHKINLFDERTGRYKGTRWQQNYDKAPNHAWDCRVYNMALLDIFVYMFCQTMDIDGLDYKLVFDTIESSIV